MQKFIFARSAIVTALITFVPFFNTAHAELDYEFYGAIKSSVNATDDGDESNISVSDNSTRVGVKGGLKLESPHEIVYQFELGLDTTERQAFNSGRNSYIGLKGEFGQVAIGQHDTPYKKVRGNGAEIFDDTIAGSRAIISAIADDDGDHLDVRQLPELLQPAGWPARKVPLARGPRHEEDRDHLGRRCDSRRRRLREETDRPRARGQGRGRRGAADRFARRHSYG